MLLQGNAYISGAASGIGKATAFEFAKSGATGLAIVDQNLEGLLAVEKEIKAKFPQVDILSLEVNVQDEKSIVDGFSRVVSHFGRINYAVNNAGVSGAQKATTDMTTDEYRRTLDINLFGVWISEREQLKHMVQQSRVPEGEYGQTRGVIVNSSSLAGLKGEVNICDYVSSKHAVIGITKSDARTYAKDHIRINCVCPGFTNTAMLASTTIEQTGALMAMIPMGRVSQPPEVASVIVFLASPMSSFMTGTPVLVDGGFQS